MAQPLKKESTQDEEIKRTDELRVRVHPDAKVFATQLLQLRYKDVSAGVRKIIGNELKSILREADENPKDYKELLNRFKT